MALKPSSQIFTIGAKVTESAPGTYTENTIDLQLNPLDNEVLEIYAVDIQLDVPDHTSGANSSVQAQLTRRSQAGVVGIDENDAIATALSAIRSNGPTAVGFENRTMADTPASSAIDYIALVATSDLFIAVDGAGNTGAKTAKVKVWARRMTADASTYAALVQSELLSN